MIVATYSHPPPAALLDAISGIAWPLDPTMTPPLYYESMEQMKAIRASSVSSTAQGTTTSTSSTSTSLLEFLQDIPGTVEKFSPWHQRCNGDKVRQEEEDEDEERYYFGLISLALVLLGHGYTDECHNLITPLSWPDDIHFAYTPSVYAKVTPAARSYATYVHSLVYVHKSTHSCFILYDLA
jgi:hypothetical protein